jgi:hypothetical protein
MSSGHVNRTRGPIGSVSVRIPPPSQAAILSLGFPEQRSPLGLLGIA